MNTKITIESKEAITAVGVIVGAAAVLGKASERLEYIGWRVLADECNTAVEALQKLTIHETEK